MAKNRAPKSKLTEDQRRDLIEKLVADLYQIAPENSRYSWQLLREGFKGFDNYTEDELLGAYDDAFDASYLGTLDKSNF